MKNFRSFGVGLSCLVATVFVVGCGGAPLEAGCTYFQACNYQPSALVDDGTCDFASCIEEEPVVASVDLSALEDFVAAPTKLNVFYRGLENPLEISVPGVDKDNVDVRIDGGHSIKRKSDGTYVVEPNKSSSVSEANISVSVELPDGSRHSLPAKKFRVKRIPDPVAFWIGKTPIDKGISKAEILSFSPVAARMEGFDFDVELQVNGFTMRISKDGSFSDLPSFFDGKITLDQQEALKRVRRGNIIYLEDIKVGMPDGTTRTLPPMKLKVTG